MNATNARWLLIGWAFTIAVAGPAPAQTVTATVPVGTVPLSVGVNPVTNKTYVANNDSNNVTVIDGASNATTTIAAGTSPVAVAVNPVTNKIYVANNASNNVTVIDGATNTTTTVAVGNAPISLAVNPVTNKIYVSNALSDDVTVIDGATGTTATVAAGTTPISVAVNPVTNKIYVVNNGSSNVTLIDGATNAATTVAVGPRPYAVALNPVTNKIYVANQFSNNVTVIDGLTNATTTVAAGTVPSFVAVNPVTNKIYVANQDSNNVTVIDGVTNATTTVAAGMQPQSLALNPVTNKICVTNQGSNNVTVIDGATNGTITLAAGTEPYGVAVNPVTNKFYVANFSSANVTVIDGSTNATTTVAAGTHPVFVAVNPVTNKIYVTNEATDNVTVIDGVTNATTTIAAGGYPNSVAVNPVTNKIYVANNGTGTVTVIDGSTNTTTTIAAGDHPVDVAVNVVTNKIYLPNVYGDDVTVIDGATNATTTVAAGAFPTHVAVNQVTNRVYVANNGSNNVTVIDGATNATTTVAVGSAPTVLALNPVTNKVYVANHGSNSVTVIDGATNATTTVAVGSAPAALALNPVTNKIYVASNASLGLTVIDGANNATTTVGSSFAWSSVVVNPVTNKVYAVSNFSDNVAVIDGATNTLTITVATGATPIWGAVNPVTNKIYVANYGSDSVTTLTEQAVSLIPLTTTIVPLAGNVTTFATPAFALSASSTFAPTAPAVRGVFVQVDTWQGAWQAATPSAGVFTATTSTLSLGTHVLYAYAVDGQHAVGCSNVGSACSPLVGSIAAYVFTVLPPADLSIVTTDSADPVNASSNFSYNLAVSNAGPGVAQSLTVTDPLPVGVTYVSANGSGWSCSELAAGTVTCTRVTLAVGAAPPITIAVTAPAEGGTINNTASVAASTADPVPGNNSDGESTVVTAQADLSIVMTDSADPVTAATGFTYTLAVSNAGPSTAQSLTVTDPLPSGVTYVLAVGSGWACSELTGTVTCTRASLAVGAAPAVGILVIAPSPVVPATLNNTASVSSTTADPAAANNSDGESTQVGTAPAQGELSHGMGLRADLAAVTGPSADEDRYRISQRPYSSYEILIDEASGDIGLGSGPLLDRVAADGGTVLQSSLAAGVGPARSLRWENSTSSVIDDQIVRVKSASCGTACNSNDTYRVRAYETTSTVARFNNSSSQITVLLLQNPGGSTIAGHVYFWNPSGTLLANSSFSLGAHQLLVLNAAGVTGLAGQSGTITLSHDGRYGELVGKAVALEPATGLSFDSPLEAKPH